jgi:hypothetical protein
MTETSAKAIQFPNGDHVHFARLRDAKRTLGKGDSSTDIFLHRCIELKLIVKEGGRYRKSPIEGAALQAKTAERPSTAEAA